MGKGKRKTPDIFFPSPLVFFLAIGCGALIKWLWSVGVIIVK